MVRYKNRGGNSGVVKYEIGPESIWVQFSDSSLYLYDYYKPGAYQVREMQKLAAFGEGLNSYINKHVRKNFAKKSRRRLR